MSARNVWDIFDIPRPVATDSYKGSHANQYIKGTTKIVSYLCARGSELEDYTIFFGLQYYLKCYFEGVCVTKNDIIADCENGKN